MSSAEPKQPKSYPLRLSRSVMEESKAAAKADAVSLNRFIELTLAEKLAKLTAEATRRDYSGAASGGPGR